MGWPEWQYGEVCWIAGGHLPAWHAPRVLAWLRGHWEVEDRIFWVRDVTPIVRIALPRAGPVWR